MNLEQATLFFLVAVFVAAEIYRTSRGRRGVIVSFDDSSLGLLALPVATVSVRLQSGSEVTATLDCCTSCLGRLRVGDDVRVRKTGEGYVVDLPWFRTRNCDAPSGACKS